MTRPTDNTTTWTRSLLQNPHAVPDKRSRVQKMFAAIAPSYDLNNRLHSLWMDQRWRRKAVKLSQLRPFEAVLDVACGTGDLTLRFFNELDRLQQITSPFDAQDLDPKVIGVDFTFEMLPIARRKSQIANRKSQIGRHLPQPLFVNGDALALPLPDASCDVLSIAFGIRNVADPAAAIREFFRVIRPGGRLIILEFGLPANSVLRALYNFYFRKILPRTATLISRDKTGAYKYLPESVNTFIPPPVMQQMMQSSGFQQTQIFPLTFGVCLCYRGIKP